MVMPFVHRVTARFFEVDRAGILFFGRVFEMCHAAYEELLLAAEADIETLIATDGVGLPLVRSEADFVKPIRLHDRLDVSIALEKLGARS
ncbi:MAG: acyl-CoA thioesterase, partial [Deltaproteobacteria bacterium]|nr:acyl-CoA thioesterase [Deltaproteobacteria bacterium]